MMTIEVYRVVVGCAGFFVGGFCFGVMWAGGKRQ